MYKDKRVEKKKTVVMKRCLNPVFNESFAFDIPTERLRETTIVITVMDKDRLSRNDVIGKVGPAAGGGPQQCVLPRGGSRGTARSLPDGYWCHLKLEGKVERGGDPSCWLSPAISGAGRGVRRRGLTPHKPGDDAVAPVQRGDALRLPPRHAAAQPAPG